MLDKITDEPVFTFKGAISSEGVTDLSVRVIPKIIEENTNHALAQFTKCLFVIENKASINYKKLIYDKTMERNKILEVRKKAAEKSDF
jgi:hypothetical protein